MGREVGGRFRMGNTCTPVTDYSQYMAKPIQHCKVISLQLKFKNLYYKIIFSAGMEIEFFSPLIFGRNQLSPSSLIIQAANTVEKMEEAQVSHGYVRENPGHCFRLNSCYLRNVHEACCFQDTCVQCGPGRGQRGRHGSKNQRKTTTDVYYFLILFLISVTA